MSEHSVNVIEIAEVRSHDNAERLEIVPVGGWQAVVAKGSFKPGDRAVYIEPDYMVPTERPEFSFLAREGRERHRLKAIRLRGVLSFGLLIPPPSDVADRPVGSDVMADLGIQRYEPPVKLARSDELPADQWPNVYASKFDVESLQRWPDELKAGEIVFVTEKIHGANAKFVWIDGVLFIGSRTQWLKPDVSHPWAVAAVNCPWIRDWCAEHPGVVLYGEIFGAVQSLKYGRSKGDIDFRAFAASERGEWWDTSRLHADPSLLTVPLLYRGQWEPDTILPLAEEDSQVSGAEPGHMREGLVIVPANERRSEAIGRVALKHISNRYWESAA